MANIISRLKATLTLDNKQFSKGLKKSQKETKEFGDSFASMGKTLKGVAIGAAAIAIAKQVAEIGKEMAQVSVFTKNAEIAFERFGGNDAYMNQLIESTGGMVDNLQLMQQAVQATNLGLEQSQLPTFFKFATIRAAETGVAVDYLVNSIVTGVGRESRLVLDNLGISLKELNKEIALIGKGFGAGAVSLINRKFIESGRNIEDVVSGVQQLETSFKNFYQYIANSGIGEFFDELAKDVAVWLELQVKGIRDLKLEGRDLAGLAEIMESLTTQLAASPTSTYLQRQIELVAQAMILLQQEGNKAIEVLKTFGNTGQGRNISSLVAVDTTSTYGAELEDGIDADLLSRGVEILSEYQKEVKDLTSDMYALAGSQELYNRIGEKSVEVMNEQKITVSEFALEMGFLAMAVVDSFASMADAFGTGDDILASIADFLIDLGTLMLQFGTLLVAFGVAEEALKYGEIYTKIAAGVALAGIAISIGSTLSNIGKSSSNGASGGTGANNNTYGGGSYGYDYNREIVLVARGQDLVAVLDRQNTQDNNNF